MRSLTSLAPVTLNEPTKVAFTVMGFEAQGRLSAGPDFTPIEPKQLYQALIRLYVDQKLQKELRHPDSLEYLGPSSKPLMISDPAKPLTGGSRVEQIRLYMTSLLQTELPH